MPFETGGLANEVRGEAGSSSGASDGRPFSSAMDLRGSPCVRRAAAVFVVSLFRGMSLERRNLAAARLMRDGFFLGPVNSPVGAVVMISGASTRDSQSMVMQRHQHADLRRGTGGGFSECCFARSDSWESEALRNRSTEKRLCLLLSSCTGGVSGRVADDARLWMSRLSTAAPPASSPACVSWVV